MQPVDEAARIVDRLPPPERYRATGVLGLVRVE